MGFVEINRTTMERKDIRMAKGSFGSYHLKSIKTWTGRDGYGYAANLYNGKRKVAHVLQEGHGGPTTVDFTKTDEKNELYELIATWAEQELSVLGCSYKTTEEDFIAYLLDDWEEHQQLKKLKKQNNISAKIGEDWFTWKLENNFDNKNQILRKYPEAIFVEEHLSTLQHGGKNA